MGRIKVTNRDNGIVGYTIPDLNNLHRNFQPGESKYVDEEEIKSLRNAPGGEYILYHYLVLENDELREDVIGDVEPEYFYTEAEVRKLLLEGTSDELEDCLNFAPEGVKDLVKTLAVNLPCNDLQKRALIKKMTGFDVGSAIEIKNAGEEGEEKKEAPKRKATPIKTTERKVVRKSVTTAAK